MRLPEPHPELERFYASAGRALALAVSFEHTCLVVALLTGSIASIEQNGAAILEDKEFADRLFKAIRKKKLWSRIETVFSFLPTASDLREAVDEGRDARNNLIHDLMKGHDVSAEEQTYEFLSEELKRVVRAIATADGLMDQLFLALHGSTPVTANQLVARAEETVTWVMGAHSAEDLPLQL